MYKNIMELLDTGKKGEMLSTRGGYGYSWYNYVFTKESKHKVAINETNSWYGNPEMKKCKKLGYLTKDYIVLYMHKRDGKWLHWEPKAFCSLNLLYNCYVRWSRGYNIFHTREKEFVPFARMKFDYKGNLLSKIPKWSEIEYQNYLKLDKLIKKQRRHLNKEYKEALSRFKEAEIKNNLDLTLPSDVFRHINSDHRTKIIEHYGLDNILSEYKSKVIDSDNVNNLDYQLIEVDLPPRYLSRTSWGTKDNQTSQHGIASKHKALYLKMINPSTGEIHLEGVPDKEDSPGDYIAEKTVVAALAWRDGDTEVNWRNDFKDQTIEGEYQTPIAIT